jgi:hypothetical protein
MTHFSEIEPQQVQVLDILAGVQRSKMAPLSLAGGSIAFKLGSPESPVTCPFHPTPYPGSESQTRLNMLLQLEPDAAAWIDKLEATVLEQLAANPERWGIKAEVLRRTWHASTKDARGARCLRIKVNVANPNVVRCWLPDGRPTPMPDNLEGAAVCATVRARHVWFTPGACGLLLEVTDLLLVRESQGSRSPWSELVLPQT